MCDYKHLFPLRHPTPTMLRQKVVAKPLCLAFPFNHPADIVNVYSKPIAVSQARTCPKASCCH